MIYFTADQHFGHANILKFCDRPFSSVEEMDEALIQNHNALVRDTDTVYCLGDFTLGSDAGKYFRRLNGIIKVVLGSHDWRWSKVKTDYYSASGILVEILPPLVTIQIGATTIALCHYAMRVWDRSHYGSLHFYGHSHGRLPEWKNALDVGVDAWDFAPVSLDRCIKTAQNTPQEGA